MAEHIAMTSLEDFLVSLKQASVPAGLPALLEALWQDARGDWDRAHQIVQQDKSKDGAWVHAYLHRKEGDLGNAGYWYRRAKRDVATGTLENEWRSIVKDLIERRSAG